MNKEIDCQSTGVYGLWYEQNQNMITEEEWPKILAKSEGQERKIYAQECKRIYYEVALNNIALNNKIAINVTLEKQHGLILRQTFTEKNPVGKKELYTFLILEDSILKVGPLTPKSLEKAEKADVDYRLSRLKMINEELSAVDLFDRNNLRDANRFASIIKESFSEALKNEGYLSYEKRYNYFKDKLN